MSSIRHIKGLLRVVFVAILTSQYSCLSAQVTATFKADSSQIEIGDQLKMKLVVNARPGYTVDFPKFADSLGPNIEIITKDKVDKAALGGDTIYSQTITTSACLLYTSPSPRDGLLSRMPSSA